MPSKPSIVCLDMEGVLTPEIWINVAERTRIEALRRTTRDEPDYDALMRGRIEILDRHGLKLRDIQEVIGALEPLPGALDFLNQLRRETQVIILSDTFYEFADPLMEKLGRPTLFCNRLEVGDDNKVIGYRLRQPDQKRFSVRALKGLNFNTIAAGDSYNDLSMLLEADRGILFRPPQQIAREHPELPVTEDYAALMAAIRPLL